MLCLSQVSAGVLQNVKDSGTSPDRKLLLLLSNCAHVRTTLVPALSEVRLIWATPEFVHRPSFEGPRRPVAQFAACAMQRFEDVLTADSAAGKAAAQELSADCCADIAQIEAQLLAVYTDAKASALDDALEE